MTKIVLSALIALFMAGPAMAGSASIGKLDISPLLERLNVCSVYTQHQDVLAGGCFSAATWTWGSANVGVTWDTNDRGATTKGIGGIIMAVGVRADKAFGYLWRKSGLEKRGVVIHFVVPSFEAGPMGGYTNSSGWIYGAFLNGKIPFGK